MNVRNPPATLEYTWHLIFEGAETTYPKKLENVTSREVQFACEGWMC